LVAFCLRHFLPDFIIYMCEFDFRQAHRRPTFSGRRKRRLGAPHSAPASVEAAGLDGSHALTLLHNTDRLDLRSTSARRSLP
jgi:hypothetical protein